MKNDALNPGDIEAMLDHSLGSIHEIIQLSEEMLEIAKAENWDEFFSASEQRDRKVKLFEQKLKIMTQFFENQDNLEKLPPAIVDKFGLLKFNITKLFDLNSTILIICKEQKDESQKALIQRKKMARISGSYRSVHQGKY